MINFSEFLPAIGIHCRSSHAHGLAILRETSAVVAGMAGKSDALDKWLEEDEKEAKCVGLREKCARNSWASRQRILKRQWPSQLH